MMSNKGRSVTVKVKSVKSSKQELMIELDFKETEEFKNKEINIQNDKFTVLFSNMLESYQSKKPLPNSNNIKKDSVQEVYFSDYPIEALDIEFYIPAEESKGASVATKVGGQIAKPVIGVLTVVAMPAAITMQKAVQSLDYLNYLNVKDLPRNVRGILEFASEGNLFSNLDPFGNFYKFDDGTDIEEPEEMSRVVRRILSAGSTVCRTHRILDKEGLSCNGWNNQGLYILQVTGLLILMVIFKGLGKWVRSVEKKII
jgi:hypothetical protein